MSDLTEQQPFLPQTRVAKSTRMPLRLTAIITALILSVMSLLTGCGGGGGSGGESGGESGGGSGGESGGGSGTGATASLTWNPVPDSSVSGYFVHYGQQSPGQAGSCNYESFIISNSSSATVTNLALNTRYYFVVSAYNGIEGPCSEEVSIVTPSAST